MSLVSPLMSCRRKVYDRRCAPRQRKKRSSCEPSRPRMAGRHRRFHSAIRDYQERGNLSDGLIFDAVRLRLIEIGEAVKRLSPALLSSEPDLPWEEIAGMRDRLAHRYFDTSHAITKPPLTMTYRSLISPCSACSRKPHEPRASEQGVQRVDWSVAHRGDGSLGPSRTRSRRSGVYRISLRRHRTIWFHRCQGMDGLSGGGNRRPARAGVLLGRQRRVRSGQRSWVGCAPVGWLPCGTHLLSHGRRLGISGQARVTGCAQAVW